MQLKRAPRTLCLSPDLHPFAFASWLHGSQHGRAPLAPPPMVAAAQQHERFAPPQHLHHHNHNHHHRHRRGHQHEQWPDPAAALFSSWRYREAASTTRAGMESSIAAVLVDAGLARMSPSEALTLDGVLQVALPLARGNARVAVEVLPPDAATRNPPHAPLGAAAVRYEMLRYRGWGVAQVLFSEWQEAMETGAEAMHALLQTAVENAEADAMCGG